MVRVVLKAFLWAETMDWFKHDTNANLNEKLQEVLLDYGLEGYGLYWYCIELIVGKVSSDNITFELKHDARIIARNTGASVQKIQEMMTRFIELGLFETSNGSITCLKVAKRLMTSATSNPQMRALIQNIKQNQLVAKASCRSHDDVMLDKNREDEIRKDLNPYVQKFDEEFLQFWALYPRKVGKDKAYESWNKKKPCLYDVVCALSWQLNSKDWIKEDGKYIPMPTTYLNQGRWQDEPPVFDEVPF